MKPDPENLPRQARPFRLISAPFTPLDESGGVRWDAIPPMAAWLRDQGVSGVFVCGTTGEGLSLTMAERLKLAEAWKAALSEDLELIVHVGHDSVEEARVLARHAGEIGADAIAAMGPCFFSVNDGKDLADYCHLIAREAPKIHFYYYHIPSMTRVGVSASQAMSAMMEMIPNFAGVKFTHEDLTDFRKCLELAGSKYEIFFGRDELLLDGLTSGARSAVGSTYNFAAPLYLAIAEAFASHDLTRARELQSLATNAIGEMIRAGGLPAVKATMELAGFTCGPVRLPLRTLSPERRAQLRETLERLGYFAAIKKLAHAALSH